MLLGGGAAVVGLRCRSWFLDVEGFELPKELAFHATALVALWLVRHQLKWRSTSLVAVGFVAWSALACMGGTNTWVALRALALTASAAAVLLVAHTLALVGHRRWVILVAVALTGWVAINVLLGAFGVPGFDAAPFRGPAGLLGVRNFAAQALVVGSGAAVALVLSRRSRGEAFAGGAVIALVVFALVLTRARTGWLAALVGVPCWAWMAARLRDGRGTSMVTAALLVGGVGVAIIPTGVSWRSATPYSDSARTLLTLDEGTGRTRILQLKGTLAAAADHPLVGVGPGHWRLTHPRYALQDDMTVRPDTLWQTPVYASSDWAAIAAERGWPAWLLLALFAWRAGRRRRGDDADDDAFAMPLLVGTALVALVAGSGNALTQLSVPSLLLSLVVGACLPDEAPPRASPVALGRLRAALFAILVAGVLLSARLTWGCLLLGDGREVADMQRAAPHLVGHGRLQSLLAVRVAEAGDCERAEVHARQALAWGERDGLVKRLPRLCPGLTLDEVGHVDQP